MAFQAPSRTGVWFEAAREGRVETIKKHRGEMLGKAGPQGVTALMLAAQHGHLELVRLLLDEARQINARGETALELAIVSNRETIVLVLAEYEANISCSTGELPLLSALRAKLLGAASLLLEYTDVARLDMNDLIVAAVETEDIAMIQAVMRRLSTIPTTALLEAVQRLGMDRPMTPALAYLIGVSDVFSRSVQQSPTLGQSSMPLRPIPLHADDETPLMKAVLSFNYQAVIREAQRYAKRLSGGRKQTALMMAVELGNESAASVLVQHEAGLHDCQGKTALILAAQRGNLSLVRLLMDSEHGLTDSVGRTALMTATISHHVPVITELLGYEAGLQDGSGKTALMYAVEGDLRDVCNLLVSFEAGIWDVRGMRAIDYARAHDREEIIELLRETEGFTAETLNFIIQHHGCTFRRPLRAMKEAPDAPKQQMELETTTLIQAVSANRYYDISVLAPYLANMRDKHGLTALQHAVLQNKRVAVRLLLPFEASNLSGWALPEDTRPEIIDMIAQHQRSRQGTSRSRRPSRTSVTAPP